MAEADEKDGAARLSEDDKRARAAAINRKTRPRRLGREEEAVAADGSSRAAAGRRVAEVEEVTAPLLLVFSFGLIAKPIAMRVQSPAFSEGGSIPRTHTCDGKDVSPPLSWSGVPEGSEEPRPDLR